MVKVTKLYAMLYHDRLNFILADEREKNDESSSNSIENLTKVVDGECVLTIFNA